MAGPTFQSAPTGRAPEPHHRAADRRHPRVRPAHYHRIVAKKLDQPVGSNQPEHVKRSGLRAFDMALMVAGGVVAVVVAFALLHFVVGIIWFAVKAVVVVGVVAAIGWMLLRRHS